MRLFVCAQKYLDDGEFVPMFESPSGARGAAHYMTKEEAAYIAANIAKVEICVCGTNGFRSLTAIVTKK